MAEKSRTTLLEVVIQKHDIASWEWRVCSGPDVRVSGFESSRAAASFAGHDTLFLLLGVGPDRINS